MEVISFNDTQLSGNCIIGTAMNSHNMMFSVWGSQTKLHKFYGACFPTNSEATKLWSSVLTLAVHFNKETKPFIFLQMLLAFSLV